MLCSFVSESVPMTTSQLSADVPSSVIQRFSALRPARAYGGAAHGRCWTVDNEVRPPLTVDLNVDGQGVRYRLVRHLRTRMAARDHLGNLVYFPVGETLDEHTKMLKDGAVAGETATIATATRQHKAR